jgi:hypothetical protein
VLSFVDITDTSAAFEVEASSAKAAAAKPRMRRRGLKPLAQTRAVLDLNSVSADAP